MQPLLVYTTFPNEQVTENTCKALLEKGLIACANIFPNMTSIYRWEGNIAREVEIAVILKTTREMEAALYTHLKSLHPYQTPCILTLKPENMDIDYLGWLMKSVKN